MCQASGIGKAGALTRAQRENIVREALSDNRIAGIDTPAVIVELMRAYIEAEIELDEAVHRGLAHYTSQL